MKFCAALFTVLILSVQGLAASPTFTNLTASDFEDISKELSANFLHHSVQGAAPLGSIFGFELGLIAGQTPVPKTNEIIKRSGGSEFSNLYHAGILGAVSVPMGITGEVVVIPKTSASGLDLEQFSAALKLSLNSHLLEVIPFNLAIRGFMSNSKFSFTQNSGGINGTIDDKNTSSGIQLLASPSLPFIEPYAGIGYVSATNELSVSGTGTVFNNSYTSGQSAEVSVKSAQYLLGITAKLLVASLGLEYSTAFGANSYTAKLAFGF